MNHSNFSLSYFEKNLHDLEYKDIEDFFAEPKEETNRIEFKSFFGPKGNIDNKINSVIRGICALLNSEGGLLIWGAPKGQQIEGKVEEIYQGELSPVDELYEKDRLISKISDKITPLPVGIKLEILTKHEKNVYVFEVQESFYKPHQFNNRYYARLDGQTRPAPHYLIEAMFKQIKFPNLNGFMRFEKITQSTEYIALRLTVLIVNRTEFQNAENVSFSISSPHGVFEKSKDQQFVKDYRYNGRLLIRENYKEVLSYGEKILYSEDIVFKQQELHENNHKAEITLKFSGRFSPLKTSRYFLNFENGLKHTNEIVSRKYENMLVSEIKEIQGFNLEEEINHFLTGEQIKS